jgi:uncharacterized protein YggE
MRKSTLILAGLLVAVLLAGAAFAPGWIARAQTQTPQPSGQGAVQASPRTLSVTGSGKAYLDPDIAYIHIGVHTENEDAKEAVEANNAGSQDVVDALRAAGIDAKDIQTTNFSIYPQQNFDPQGKPLSTRYVVDNTVYVTLRKLDNLGTVLEAAIDAGANAINGIQFDVADRTEALAEARRAALANAGELAQEMATAAGLELGEIQHINTFTGGFPGPMFEGRGGGGYAMDVASAVPVAPGQLVVSVDVSVVYEIE